MPLLKTLVLAYTAAGVNAFATFPSQEGGAALPERMTYGGTVGGTSAKPLDSVGGTAYELAECQGDCDSDADCQAGLKCFQRTGAEQVPGCYGSGTSGWDYCAADASQPANKLLNIGSNPLAFGSGRLFECQGDCDNDDDCQTGLKCFQRDGYDAVPGCGEAGQGKKGWDYCVADGDAKLYSGGTCPSGMTQFSGGCIDVTEQEPSECSVNGKDIFGPSKKACEERGLALCSMQEYLDAYMDGAATTGKQTYGISSTTCLRAHDDTSPGHFLVKNQGKSAGVSGCHGNANCWSNRYYRCCSGGASKVTCGAGAEVVNGECVAKVECGGGTKVMNGKCVAEVTCGGGTKVVGGECVPKVECGAEVPVTIPDPYCGNYGVITHKSGQCKCTQTENIGTTKCPGRYWKPQYWPPSCLHLVATHSECLLE